MTITIFLVSLLGAMAHRHADRLCAAGLRRGADAAARSVRFPDHRPEHHQRCRQLPADGGAVLHARRRDHERRRPVQADREPGAVADRARPRWPRLRRDPGCLPAGRPVRLGGGRRRGPVGAAGADDGQGRPRQGPLGRPGRRRRDHRPDHPAQHRLRRVRRRQRPVDLQAVPGRHLPRALSRPGPGRRLVVGGAQGEPGHAAPDDRQGEDAGVHRQPVGAGPAVHHHLRPEVRHLHARPRPASSRRSTPCSSPPSSTASCASAISTRCSSPPPR